ncbi:hypothetical protein yc1106_07228 [Curvularia clavata]|uniref:DNA-binding protein REB1 n=1 Tax=Curvularia clavata TaxID=95742 RepID=A0A9Q8ZEE6_CURCL|nr:hypothetical protein yc1106_07228 [Curvularia clavata]
MATSSPGYAILNDLRRSMGTSSSQPMPTPSRDANVSTMASSSLESRPHLSPNMDDVAASQQLMDEGARANPTPSSRKLSQLVGAHDRPASARKKRNRNKVKATQKSPETSTVLDEAPTSPFPFPATQPEAEEITRTPSGELRVLPALSGSSHAVQVPDSQIAAIHMSTPVPPPRSSYVVPSSATKSKKTYKKSRQAKRDQIIQDVLMRQTVDELADGNIGTQDPPSPSHATAPHKRQRVGDTDTGFQDAVVDVAPVAPKRRKTGTPMSANTVQDLIHTSSNDDERLQPGSKTKLKRIKKPHTPIAASKNIYDIPDDEPGPANGMSEGLHSSAVDGFMRSGSEGESDDLQETPSLKKSSAEKKKKRRKSGGDVYHRHTSVRRPGQPLGETSKNEQYNGELIDDPISGDDGDLPHPPPQDTPAGGRSEKKERKEKSQGKKKNKTPHEEARSEEGGIKRYRRSIGGGTGISSAERALNTVRDLSHPPDLRENGVYTDDEEELIRRAIKDYQQRKGLEVSELVEIIQWNQFDPRFHREPGVNRNKSEWAPQDREDMEESTEFWDEIKSIGLRRSHERVRIHVRQLYHQFKSGAWTEEDDEQLRNLQAAYPNQWKLISISMGNRSMYDCVNRWRDYLQYGNDRKTSRWTKDEEDLLIRAVMTVAQRDEDDRAKTGRPSLDVYTNKDISWPQVAREMGNTRSRIQASTKWTQMMRRSDPPQLEIEYKPRTLAAAQADISTPKEHKRRQKKDASNKNGDQALRRRRKSQKHAEGSDREEETEELEEQVQDGPEPATGSAARKKHRQPKHSDDEPQDQASANNGSTNSSPPKTKRGRRRKSEVTESDKPQKRRKPGAARDESKGREADEEQQEHETSDSHVQNKTNIQGKERAKDSENEEVSEPEEYQTSRDDVEEGPEKHKDEVPSDEAGEGQEQGGEKEQGDEAIDEDALSGDGQEDETQDEEARMDEAQENEVEEEAQEKVQNETSESSDTTQDSRHDAAEVEVQSEVGSEIGSATPLPKEHNVPEGSAEPSVDQMLWGDKYDLIFKLLDRRDDYKEDIDWEDVRKDQAYPWSEETLKAALGQLIQLVRDTGREVDADDFPGTIDDVMDLITKEHAAELEEHYSPS